MRLIKTALIAIALIVGPLRPIFASSNPIIDQLSVDLLGHMETIVETTSHGKTNAEMLLTPIQIGRMNGNYLVGVDGGVLGDVAPSSIGDHGFNWTAGVHLHLAPLIKKYIAPGISPDYRAITSLEINPRVSYLFANQGNGARGGWQVGFGIGWSFALSPQQ